MVQSIANWTSFLQAETAKGGGSEPNDPEHRVLAALKQVSTMPLNQIASAARLDPNVALSAIESLRGRSLIEVYEQTDRGPARFISLTSLGYAALANIK